MKTQENKSPEKKILKTTLILSFFLHLLIGLSTLLSVKSSPKKQSRSISAEFVMPKNISGKSLSMKKKNKTKETKVHKNTLPQLPKNFVIKEKIKKKRAIRHSIKEENKAEEQKRKKKKEDAIELTKEEAFKRLLKEKARLKKKHAKKNTLAIKKEMNSIELLKARKLKEQADGELSFSDDEGYADQMQSWLHDNYELPEAFDLSFQRNEVLLEITLNNDGKVITASVLEPSKNPIFDKFALNTVWKASPFPKPPGHWARKKIQLHFTP